MRRTIVFAAGLVAFSTLAVRLTHGQDAAPDPATLLDAQRHFYNARYAQATALTRAVPPSPAGDPIGQLAVLELRTSSLHFQIKNAVQSATDKEKALKQCVPCAAWLKEFFADIAAGQIIARARIAAQPDDNEALFFLGKIDLNYVWLQLGTLGKKTGWDEYWEARKSLDTVLKRRPAHVRAQVARAWIDYIVDTRMPRGTRWLLGGGNKKRALVMVREAAASAEADFFAHTEAEFALWEMQVRERKLAEAADVARRLTRDFPENRELAQFLQSSGQ